MRTPEGPPLRTLALCADDFGLSPGICAAIVRLAQGQRLNAISCMTNSAYWEASAPSLSDLPASVDVGLHLNLTEGRPLSRPLEAIWPRLPQLRRLILQSYLGQLPMPELRVELQAQLEAFRNATGADPAYIDGHQHIHHLPGLRDIVLDMADRMQPRAAVRNTAHLPGSTFALKRWLIRNTGGRQLTREIDRRGLSHNAVLLGAYDFRQTNYRTLMQGWLKLVPEAGALLFCHPGYAAGEGIADGIIAAREREFAYLGSDAFPGDIALAKVQLGRVWRTGPIRP